LITCQKCRALLEPGTKRCPYCGTDQRHQLAPSESEEAAATARFGLWMAAVIAGLFLLMLVVDPARGDRKGLAPSGACLDMFGAASWGLVHHCGQYWRLLASMFLHLDLLHLAFNAVALWLLIPIAAQTFGTSRTVVIYLASGLTGGIVSHLAGNSGVGASGALCGLIAASAVFGKRRGGFLGDALMRRMLLWGLIIVAFGFFQRQIDNAGHFGGFAGGALLGWPAAAVRARGGRVDRLWNLVAWIAVVGVLAVAVLYWLPSVKRGFERRDVEFFRAEALRTLDRIGGVLEGSEGVTLPDGFEDGPPGTQEVAGAVRAALKSAREKSPEARARLAEARLAWQEWAAGLYCAYGIT